MADSIGDTVVSSSSSRRKQRRRGGSQSPPAASFPRFAVAVGSGAHRGVSWEPQSSSGSGSFYDASRTVLERRVVAVVGVGPGLGLSIARRFAHEDYVVVLLARNGNRLETFAKEIAEKEPKMHVSAIRIDCSDAKKVKEAFESVRSLGVVEVLVYNVGAPAQQFMRKFTDISPEAFEKSLTLPCLGAFLCAQEVLPGMLKNQRGTMLFTGGSTSIKGLAGSSETACGKFALRALSQCLAREYHPHGIHVAHIIVDGVIDRNGRGDGETMNPTSIAEMYWQLHIQDRCAWTQELDLRPFNQRF